MRLQVDQVGEPRHLQGVSQKTGKEYDFYTYSFKSGANWYECKGKGAEALQPGQPIVGTVEVQNYTTKDGKAGSKSIFTLVAPEIAEIYTRLDKLEKVVFAGEGQIESSEREENSEIDISQIPF